MRFIQLGGGVIIGLVWWKADPRAVKARERSLTSFGPLLAKLEREGGHLVAIC